MLLFATFFVVALQKTLICVNNGHDKFNKTTIINILMRNIDEGVFDDDF